MKIKVKVELMSDGCADTSVADIGNCFVEVSCAEKNITLVGFYDKLSKTIIPIGDTVTKKLFSNWYYYC